ncbi:MAG: hypothetical protein Q4P18_00760 [Methanobrevibacter sp.]|uniref:hypothetical protein n=1 Tax=Methanobrevibacter sp. TaxID=66852 RepID=UPI0026E01566|nr:hypothetical protein [Methanobrevibacter sp.]MDO5848050.1 hypothetical protein [Methanobrevibacter sp.]
MPKSKIKFYQEAPKSFGEGDKIEIKWIVVNDSDFHLEKVKGFSQEMVHEFGEIKAHSKVEFSFPFVLPSIDLIKADFGEDATISNPFVIGSASLTFSITTDTFTISSNSLEVSF